MTENAALVNYVRNRCGEQWQAGTVSKQGGSGNTTLGTMGQQAVKMYYTRHFANNLDSSWPSSHPWEQEDPTLESQLMGSTSLALNLFSTKFCFRTEIASLQCVEM